MVPSSSGAHAAATGTSDLQGSAAIRPVRSSIPEGTVVVNRAFLQDIKSENRALRQTLRGIGDELSAQNPRPRQLAEQLTSLRDLLAMHFSLEETFGYFDDPCQLSPQMSDEAKSLRSQHGPLYRQLCDLVAQAQQLHDGTSQHELPSVRTGFFGFYARLQEHERREGELVICSLYEEIGVGD